MTIINIGDIVTRKSYNNDVIFRVYDIRNEIAYLSGITLRIIADAPLDDLVKVSVDYFLEYQEKYIIDSQNRIEKNKRMINDDKLSLFGFTDQKRSNVIKIPGKILHIDRR